MMTPNLKNLMIIIQAYQKSEHMSILSAVLIISYCYQDKLDQKGAQKCKIPRFLIFHQI